MSLKSEFPDGEVSCDPMSLRRRPFGRGSAVTSPVPKSVGPPARLRRAVFITDASIRLKSSSTLTRLHGYTSMRVDRIKKKILVVGAGFAGSVIAERAASSGHSVDVIDKRGHIAGNAFDGFDAHGVLIHQYGPHVFHTNSDKVAAYLSRFTDGSPTSIARWLW